MAAEKQLLKRFGVTDAPPCPALDDLGYYDAVDTMERVGAAALGGFSTTWQSATSLGLDPAVVRVKGFALIASGDLAPLLDELLAGFKRKKPDVEPAFTTAYGWFYHWFNLKGGPLFSEFLSDAFVAHGKNNFHIHGAVSAGSTDDPIPPATYTLEKAAKECGIGRTSMRKLGVQLGMVREEAKTGHVLVFDGPTVRSVANDLRESVDQNGVIEKLGVHWAVAKDLLRSGAITPLFNGRQWRHHFVFRVQDLDDFIRRVCADAPTVDEVPEGMMSASKAREHLNMSGGFFLKLILDGNENRRQVVRSSRRVRRSRSRERTAPSDHGFGRLRGSADSTAAVVLTTTTPP